jgi:acyl-coenzyme A thioesterase PaaI-like protein
MELVVTISVADRASTEVVRDCDNTTTFLVHNHLHTVHAIASCNAAEMAMGMLMEATVPTSHRWIPKAMTVQYLAKATTSLRATARIDPPDFGSITEGAEVLVPVSVTDRSGTEVVHADITTWVTPVA